MQTHEPRQHQYVNKKVQGALALQMVRHWLIFFCVGCCVTAVFQYLLDPFQSLGDVLYQFWQQQRIFIIVALLLLPGFVLDSIKLSHRVVGPLVRVRTALHSLANGEAVAPLKFRPRDFWHDLAAEFNDVIERYQSGATVADSSTDESEFATQERDAHPVASA